MTTRFVALTGLLLASTGFTQTPVQNPGAAKLTPTPLPAGTPVQLPGANNGPFRLNGVTPGAAQGGVNSPAGGGDLVYDNGSTDGTNGYSNIGQPVGSGLRRTLLDDFTLATGADLGCLTWTHVWGSGEPAGTGVTAELSFLDDAGGAPGATLGALNVTDYTEVETGSIFFSRPEIASSATFDPVSLSSGTYWFEGTVVDATAALNNFWLVQSTINGSECWANYEDFGGLQPGTSVFGVAADLNFALYAPETPGCGDTLLFDGGAPDGVNGYSNIGQAVGSGLRRTLLDDFKSTGMDVTCLSWNHVWGSGEPAGTGVDAEFNFWSDASGSPGATIATANVTAYTEFETGGIFFSRPEITSVANIDPVNFGAGIYWFEGTVVDATGGLNNFWLTAPQVGSECWINYEDLGGLQPGSALFGTASGINFSINGIDNPTCGVKYCGSSQNANNSALIDIDTCDSSSGSINVSLSNGPANQFIYLLVGDGNGTVSQPPGAKGDLCVVGGSCLGRYDKDVGQIDSAGGFNTDILNAISTPCAGAVNIAPGATWNFQYWHRQPMGAPATFSEAVSVTFN